jgi:hypothetical protein
MAKNKKTSQEIDEAKKKRKEYNRQYYLEKKKKEVENIQEMSLQELELYNEQLEKNRTKLNEKNKNKTREQRDLRNAKQKERRAKMTREDIEQRSQYNAQQYIKSKNQPTDLDKLIDEFNNSINQPLDKVCIMCRRVYYEDQVNLNYMLTNRHLQLIESMYEKLLIKPNQKVICCFTCIEYLKKNKLPNIYFDNQLYPGDIPEQLEILTEIELTLISMC